MVLERGAGGGHDRLSLTGTIEVTKRAKPGVVLRVILVFLTRKKLEATANAYSDGYPSE